MVGRACGLAEGKGVRPGTYCEPKMTSVGSQDTTGPMTRDELKDLACLWLLVGSGDAVVLPHAAYPKPVDVKMHHELPDFISTRGGIALRPGDGIIHSWLNRMLLPDTVGTGGDSHTRFPIGISFPAGWPCRLRGGDRRDAARHAGIGAGAFQRARCSPASRCVTSCTRSFVRHQGRPFDRCQAGQENIFSGRILEIEGCLISRSSRRLSWLMPRQNVPAAGCTVALNEAPIVEYLKSNIVLLKAMIADGYQDPRTLNRPSRQGDGRLDCQPETAQGRRRRRVRGGYRDQPRRDHRSRSSAARTIRTTPRRFSDVAGAKIDEVFIGSCMTNIGHFPRRRQTAPKASAICRPNSGWHRRPRWTPTS